MSYDLRFTALLYMQLSDEGLCSGDASVWLKFLASASLLALKPWP